MSSKKYIISLAAISGLLLAMVSLLNAYVDPLVKFRLSDHIYYSAERELKPKLLERGNFDGLIIGNSKVTYIQTDDMLRYGKILNAGFSAASIEEIRYFLEEMNPKVKWVGIGLDFFMFSTSPAYKFRTGKYFNNIPIYEQIEYIVSSDTLRYSLKSISKYIRGVRQRYTFFGARNKKYLESGDKEKYYHYYNSIKKMKSSSYLNYKYSKKRIEELKIIQKWADVNNITLIAWINPYETEILKIIKANIGNEVSKITNEIKQVLHNVIDLSDAYGDKDNFWKKHPIHYYPSTAEKFFSEKVIPLVNKTSKN